MGFTTLLLTLSLAQAPTDTWGLTWNAPHGCIRSAELGERIERRLGRSLFGARPSNHIDGHAALEGKDWKARLTLVDAKGTLLGSRELVSSESDCRALDDRLVLIAVLMIQPAIEAAEAQKAKPVDTRVDAPVVAPTVRLKEVVVTDDGHRFDDGRAIDLAGLYWLARRPDLVDRLDGRRTSRIVLLSTGIALLAVGGVIVLSAAVGLGCESFSGGGCVSPSTGLLLAGASTAGVGLLSTVVSRLIPIAPTNLQEDRALAAAINAKRREK
jgi:hypothetical protein